MVLATSAAETSSEFDGTFPSRISVPPVSAAACFPTFLGASRRRVFVVGDSDNVSEVRPLAFNRTDLLGFLSNGIPP
jgi:hypothetical protein